MGDPHAAPDQPTLPVGELPVGAPIYSRDNQHLGTVKEARDRCFLVDVRLAFDYWLSRRCVAAVRDGQVVLAVDKREVSQYLVDIDGPDEDDSGD